MATKYAGRLADILVQEGDFVTAGQVLAHMQTEVLNAQRDEAFAQQQQGVPCGGQRQGAGQDARERSGRGPGRGRAA